MAGIERANGHRPTGLLHLLDPSLKLAPHPKQEDLDFDLNKALDSVVRLTSEVPEDAFSARTLGIEREGNAVLISDWIFSCRCADNHDQGQWWSSGAGGTCRL